MAAKIVLKELGLTYVEPMEIKLVEGYCFHLTVLISRQKKTEVFDCQSKNCSLNSISPF